MKDRVRCLSAPGPLHCGLFPSEDRANRTRSHLGENVFARVCVCVCVRAQRTGEKNGLATVEGKKKPAFELLPAEEETKEPVAGERLGGQ